MASLANITQKLRKVLKIGAAAAVGLFILYLLITGGIFLKNIFFPTAPEAAEAAFGELPSLEFSNSSANVNYQINTVSGELPTGFPDRMLVYKIKQPKPDLLALQNARKTASNADFTEQETEISETLYQWTNPSSNAVLQYNINTKNFDINSNYISNPNQNLLTSSGFPEQDRIKGDISEFLNNLNENLENLTFRDNSIEYLAITGSGLQSVDNTFNADVVRVSLYQKNIENNLGEFPIVYPNPNYSIINIVASYPSARRMIVLGGQSYNHTVLRDENSDYYIKTPEEAFEELQNGQGYLFNPTNKSSIEITDVYLAYYLDTNNYEYLQPVVVFEGPDTISYVPALKTTQSINETSE